MNQRRPTVRPSGYEFDSFHGASGTHESVRVISRDHACIPLYMVQVQEN